MIELNEEILLKVQKPARYVGGEVNSVVKDKNKVDVRFAFCFPDVYEVGMSHLGLKIIYHLLNERDDVYCERAFAPWTDMEQQMRENNIPLYALESKDPLYEFDFVGFTLQYEMSYTNILNMLDMAKIPFYSHDRDKHPFIVFGGPCAYNPEPLADIADLFVLGEGEEVLNEIIDLYKEWKKTKGSRLEFLEKVNEIEGVYVPSLYEIEYNDDGTIKRMNPKKDTYKLKVTKKNYKGYR